jgi:hypothetical protein
MILQALILQNIRILVVSLAFRGVQSLPFHLVRWQTWKRPV